MMGHEEIASKCQHINFGLVLGMSTRKGTVKFLDVSAGLVVVILHSSCR